MTEEEARQLREAYAKREEEAIQKDRRIEDLEGRLVSALLRIEELERRLAKDSHNSSKPPSSDGFKRQGKKRPTSNKTKGGQAGHPGHALELVEKPDQVMIHRPSHCEACHGELGVVVVGHLRERRQIHELPVMRLVVTEHQVEVLTCPVCQHQNAGTFPSGVQAPAQYGPRVQALAVYLSQYQLLPMERIGEAFEDLLSCRLSQGTLATWIQEAARTLGPTMLLLKRLLLAQKLDYVDETGGRVKGLLHWFHVNATQWLTLYHWHRKRGQEAMDAIGVLPGYTGRAVHDRWSSYDHYGCAHSVCGAHLLRDCLLIAERDHHRWAQEMHDLLVCMCQTTARFRVTGADRLPQAVRNSLVLQYFAILQQGFATHRTLAPPPGACVPKKPGRRKQDDAKNLLDALLAQAEQVLAFLDDLSIPFTNNQAERDLRMIKVQQKISGTFRSEQGASAFCTIRSYLSTMRKQGRSMLAALAAAFEGSPFSIAWEPGT
jgi:transposase